MVFYMLKVTKDENGYIKVEEQIPEWFGTDCSTTLYDLENQRSKYNDDPWYKLTDSAMQYVQKYYVLKLEKINENMSRM